MLRISPNAATTQMQAPTPAKSGRRLFSLAGKSMRCKDPRASAPIPKPVPFAKERYATWSPSSVDVASRVPDVAKPRPAAAVPNARPDMPEIELHTPEGALRRDVAMKVLACVEQRLTQVLDGPAAPRIREAAGTQRSAVRGLLHDLGAPLQRADATAPTSASAADAGLDIADSAKLIYVLRQTRQSVCPQASWFARALRALSPATGKKTVESNRNELLDMLLKYFDVQALGGWAALVRRQVEAAKIDGYAAYARPGESLSTFFGGAGMVPVFDSLTGTSAGVVVGASVLGRDLTTSEDGAIEQSKWWSATLGAALKAGLHLIKVKLSLTGTVTRKKGVFFDDVEHLVQSRMGNPHSEKVYGPKVGRLMGAMAGVRLTGMTGMKLADLDALQEKAFAQRDIFAKVVGPISMSAADPQDSLHIVGVNRRAPDVVQPCDFTATTTTATARAEGEAGFSALIAAGVSLSVSHALLKLTARPQLGFWEAVDPATRAPSPTVRAERVAELRAAGARIAPALAHLPSVSTRIENGRALSEPFLIDTATAPQVRQLFADLEQEFDRYCYARRQMEAGMPRHVAQARAIEASWGIKDSGRSVYAYVQRLRIVHALAGLRLEELGEPGDPLFAKFARKLDAPELTSYDARKARTHITFSDELDMVEHHTPIALNAGVTMLGQPTQATVTAGLHADVRAEVRTRRDWNILRDGNYLDVAFELGFRAGMDIHVPAIAEFLQARASDLGLDQGLIGKGVEAGAGALKDSLAPGLQGGAALRVTYGYYQPPGTKGLDAMCLQHVRVTSRHNGPVHQKSHLLSEKLGTETLSYLFMRHHTFLCRPADEGKRHWENFCTLHREAIGKMMAGLGDPGGGIRADAEEYWSQTLRCAEDDGEKEQLASRRTEFFAAMSRYAAACSTGDERAAYDVAKPVLDEFARLHMRPWEVARARHVKHKARLKLLD